MSKFASNSKVFFPVAFYSTKEQKEKKEKRTEETACVFCFFLFLLLCGQLKEWLDQLKKYQWAKKISYQPKCLVKPWFSQAGLTSDSVLWGTGTSESACVITITVPIKYEEGGAEKALCAKQVKKQSLELHPLALLWSDLNWEMQGPPVHRTGVSAFVLQAICPWHQVNIRTVGGLGKYVRTAVYLSQWRFWL